MNFADIRKKFSGGDRAASADPSRAFGSEAEMMQALRKQEFTPPKPRPTAAEVMGSIRQRFARPAEEMQDRIPRDEAAARTYAPEAMAQPEWENPFTAPEKPKKPARDVPVYETVGGDMPFERRSPSIRPTLRRAPPPRRRHPMPRRSRRCRAPRSRNMRPLFTEAAFPRRRVIPRRRTPQRRSAPPRR